MEPAANDSAFRIFAYRSKKRTVRFLVSRSVMERIPFLEEVLMRAVAGTGPHFVWPASVFISGQDEWLPIPGDSLHIMMPTWLYERIAERHAKPLPWTLRLGGYVTTVPLSWDISYVLACYLNPLQVSDKCRDSHILIYLSLFMPFEYRPMSTALRAMVFVPLLLSTVSIILVGSVLFRKNKWLLYARARIQREFGRRKGLSKTRERLFELGEPTEKLKEFVLAPDLKVLEKEEEKENSE
jgi:hypothetical protein